MVAERDPADTSPPIGVQAVAGSPAAVLLDVARNADLLVLGHRGHGAFSSALLGLACSASCTPPARSRSSVPPRRDRRPLPPTRRPRRSVPNQAPWCWRVLKRRDATQSNGRATCASRSQVLHSPALTVLIGTSREIADGSAELGAPWPVVHIVRLALGATVVQVGGERMEPWTPHGCLTFDKWNAGVQGVDASVYPSERGSARKCLRPRLAFGAEVRPWPPCASVGCRVAYRGLAAGVPRRQRARCDLRSTKRGAVGVRGPHC